MKRRVSLCSKGFDVAGSGLLELLEGGLSIQQPRRSTRTLTLDGGVSFSDGGFSISDLTISVEVRRSQTADDLVDHLQQYHNRVTLSCHEGFFTCGGMDVTRSVGSLSIRLLPESGVLRVRSS